MSIVEPLPSTGYGVADWVDYSNYWRDADATWLMERTVLRYASPTLRTTQWPTPKYGQVTYNETTGKLEVFANGPNDWAQVQAYANLTSTLDSTAGVSISHKNASGKGIVFQPSQTLFDNPVSLLGVLKVLDTTGVTIQTGTKVAKLTTSTTSLVSDSPISAPGGTLTGALTATALTLSGTLTGVSATLSDTLTANVVNGTTGAIGGVAFNNNRAVADAGGFASQWGWFTGDGSSALVKARNASSGVVGSAAVQVDSATVSLSGSSVILTGASQLKGGGGMRWYNAAGVATAWISPSLYSATDPGAANFPDGTIWVS